MRIISCQIENFGKLSHKKIDFDTPLHVCMEENGYGKSTLATFIRVMFYGFRGEAKRKNTENERKRFKPWQGGVYGGELTFEKDGKRYIITRIFGAKEAEDDFLLRDEKTGLPVDDYTANIGEELFEIDSDSFMRTVFISQNDCETAVTGSINAKLGNLAFENGDIETYEHVEKNLADLLNNISETRRTGQIYKKKRTAAELSEELRRKPGVLATIEELKGLRDEKLNRKEELLVKQNEIKDKLSKLSAEKDKQVLTDRFAELKNALGERQEARLAAKSAFPGEIPDVADIDAAIVKLNRYEELLRRLQDLELSEEQKKIFDEEGVTAKELDEIYGKWMKKNAVEAAVSAKRATYETLEGVCRTEEMQRAQREMNLKKRKDFGEKQKREEARITGRRMKLGILRIVAGLVMLSLIYPGFLVMNRLEVSEQKNLVIKTGVTAFLGLLGLLMIILGIYTITKRRSGAGGDDSQEEDTLPVPGDSKAQLEKLARELEADGAFIEETEDQVRDFCERISMAYDPYSFSNVLLDIKNSRRIYEEKQPLYAAAEAEYRALEQEKNELFSRIGLTAEEHPAEQLLKFRENLSRLAACEEELAAAEKRYQDFQREHSAVILNPVGKDGEDFSVSELSDGLAELTNEINDTVDAIHDYGDRLNRVYEDLDRIIESEERLQIVNEEIEELKNKRQIAELTKSFLADAKTSFTAKYMKPIREGFEKYYSLLTGEQAEDYGIDANMELTKKEAGKPRELEYFSAGSRDLIGICMRMALVSAMYEKEKPIIVFDDPFTNLDTKKTEQGKRLLKEIAKDYQVIYFTCHESRR